jgi:hypothetical protein
MFQLFTLAEEPKEDPKMGPWDIDDAERRDMSPHNSRT